VAALVRSCGTTKILVIIFFFALELLAARRQQIKRGELDEGLGGIAQLGERLHGMQEVSGSIPLTSTITANRTRIAVKAKSTEHFAPFV
jgi:hypothetical protein